MLCYVNAYLARGIIPKDWKRANVVAICKKVPKYNAGNYRPVSLTSQVCKILESILKDRMTEHLLKFTLTRETQHGLLK